MRHPPEKERNRMISPKLDLGTLYKALREKMSYTCGNPIHHKIIGEWILTMLIPAVENFHALPDWKRKDH
jgi:hypothetical protein